MAPVSPKRSLFGGLLACSFYMCTMIDKAELFAFGMVEVSGFFPIDPID